MDKPLRPITKRPFAALTLLTAGLAGPPAPAAEALGITVERTEHGVVHVTANDYRGIGYGVGHAYVEDNRCLLAERVAQVNGRLSAQIGPDAIVRMMDNTHYMRSLHMDALYRYYFDTARIRAGFAAGPKSARDLAAGYAAGVNRYLKDHLELPACAGANFTADLTVDDVYRMWVATAALASAEFTGPFLAISELSAKPQPGPVVAPPRMSAPSTGPIGSNAWALGRDVVRSGGPLHFYTPHFPWGGIQRMYLVHVRIPGELDVMGPALGAFPIPVAGFTKDVAWGLTFSVAPRVTLMEFEPQQSDPTTYLVDGKPRRIQSKILPIEVANEASPREVAIQTTADGPIIWAATLGLPVTSGYVVRDVNRNNTRVIEQFLQVAKAHTVREVKSTLEAIQGVPWSYTLATDAGGETLFGDLSAVPNVSARQYRDCGNSPTAPFLLALGVYALDGTRSECYWTGRLRSGRLPSVLRTDYVANQNNNYELPNLDARLSGYSPIFGLPNQGLSLRANLGLMMIKQRLDGSDGFGKPGFSTPLLKTVFADKRHRAGELLVDDIVALCTANPSVGVGSAKVNLRPVCAALKAWDRKTNLDSRGAHVFHGLWAALQEQGLLSGLFAVPASLDEPLTTPSGLSTDPGVRDGVLAGLGRVAVALRDAGIAPDAAWGDVSFVIGKDGQRYGIPGGAGAQGSFDAVFDINQRGFDGWVASLNGHRPEDLYGPSYAHVVELGAEGPKARGRLAYSQATEPQSPWYLDQLGLLQSGGMFKLPFNAAEILAERRSLTRF
ncbi:MAG: penicillin acylase family protein [Methylotetracoccus sp.]